MMAAKRKGKPFMKCKVAGKRELKTLLPTRKHKLSTQAIEANSTPWSDGSTNLDSFDLITGVAAMKRKLRP